MSKEGLEYRRYHLRAHDTLAGSAGTLSTVPNHVMLGTRTGPDMVPHLPKHCEFNAMDVVPTRLVGVERYDGAISPNGSTYRLSGPGECVGIGLASLEPLRYPGKGAVDTDALLNVRVMDSLTQKDPRRIPGELCPPFMRPLSVDENKAKGEMRVDIVVGRDSVTAMSPVSPEGPARLRRSPRDLAEGVGLSSFQLRVIEQASLESKDMLPGDRRGAEPFAGSRSQSSNVWRSKSWQSRTVTTRALTTTTAANRRAVKRAHFGEGLREPEYELWAPANSRLPRGGVGRSRDSVAERVTPTTFKSSNGICPSIPIRKSA